jgi:hypothetical protein
MDINRVKAVSNPFEHEEYQKKQLKEGWRPNSQVALHLVPTTRRKARNGRQLQFALPTQAKGQRCFPKSETSCQGTLVRRARWHLVYPYFMPRNPSGVVASTNKKNNLDSDSDDDDSVQNDAKDVPSDDGEVDDVADDHHLDDVNSNSDDDGFQRGTVRGEAYEAMKELEGKQKQEVKNEETTNHVRSA